MTPYYQQSGVTIYHGDCRHLIGRLSADLLLTDPPYGIGADRKQRARARASKRGAALCPSRDYGVSDWDSAPPPQWVLDCAIELTRHQIIWGGNYFRLPPARGWLVWDKDNGNNNYADCELAWTNLDRAVRKIRHRWMGMLQEDMRHKETRYHPTQKPVPVMSWAIGLAPVPKSISAVGIEADERYCEIAAKRLSAVGRR